MKIAVIGMGVVGTAVADGSRKCDLVVTYDKFNPDATTNMHRLDETKIAFVCVPTPTFENGQDLSAIDDVLETLTKWQYKGVVAIKSTVIPGSMNKLQCKYDDLRLVHNPEFLSARSAKQDFIAQETVLISGEIQDCAVVDEYYDKILQKKSSHISTNFLTTEWAKYIHNCSLPVILSFLNEIYSIVSDNEIFFQAAEMAFTQGNLPRFHSVPGPDDKFGWGGSCFVKDTWALELLFRKENLVCHTLTGAIITNKLMRPEAYDGTEKTGLYRGKK